MKIDLIETQDFEPTHAMKLYAFHRAKHGKKLSNSKISKLVGIRSETISRWSHINGFSDWLEQEIAIYAAPLKGVLEQKALEMIQKGDFRFWEAMAKRESFLEEPEKGPQVFQLAYKL